MKLVFFLINFLLILNQAPFIKSWNIITLWMSHCYLRSKGISKLTRLFYLRPVVSLEIFCKQTVTQTLVFVLGNSTYWPQDWARHACHFTLWLKKHQSHRIYLSYDPNTVHSAVQYTLVQPPLPSLQNCKTHILPTHFPWVPATLGLFSMAQIVNLG